MALGAKTLSLYKRNTNMGIECTNRVSFTFKEIKEYNDSKHRTEYPAKAIKRMYELVTKLAEHTARYECAYPDISELQYSDKTGVVKFTIHHRKFFAEQVLYPWFLEPNGTEWNYDHWDRDFCNYDSEPALIELSKHYCAIIEESRWNDYNYTVTQFCTVDNGVVVDKHEEVEDLCPVVDEGQDQQNAS